MTLDTRIYVHGQVDVHELFRHGQTLLHIADLDEGRENRTTDRMKWTDEACQTHVDGEWVDDPSGGRCIRNSIGQGLPAILDITYREGGPLKADPNDCDRYCGDDCDREIPHNPASWCEISLDTAYSYQTSIGRCSDLHAALIVAFGAWLSDRGVTFSWQNEYTGEIFQGADGLETLAKGGEDAMQWFDNVATPTIALMIATGAEPTS